MCGPSLGYPNLTALPLIGSPAFGLCRRCDLVPLTLTLTALPLIGSPAFGLCRRCDLVPTRVTAAWLKHLSKEAPTLAFH
eukprot:7344097-Prymnesium_polylepis.1